MLCRNSSKVSPPYTYACTTMCLQISWIVIYTSHSTVPRNFSTYGFRLENMYVSLNKTCCDRYVLGIRIQRCIECVGAAHLEICIYGIVYVEDFGVSERMQMAYPTCLFSWDRLNTETSTRPRNQNETTNVVCWRVNIVIVVIVVGFRNAIDSVAAAEFILRSVAASSRLGTKKRVRFPNRE